MDSSTYLIRELDAELLPMGRAAKIALLQALQVAVQQRLADVASEGGLRRAGMEPWQEKAGHEQVS